MREIEYDEWECSSNTDARCPYCGHENEMILENEYDGDESEAECGNCEKTFMYTVRVTVNFDTRPAENYYLSEKERISRRIEHYKSSGEEMEYWERLSIERLEKELEQLEKWKSYTFLGV